MYYTSSVYPTCQVWSPQPEASAAALAVTVCGSVPVTVSSVADYDDHT